MPDNKLIVDPADFNAEIGGDALVMAKFQTKACVICRRIDPALQGISKRLGDRLSVFAVDAEQSPFLAERFNVRAVPTLILSGTMDPVTPPSMGALAARHLPNSLHVVIPGFHGVGGPCVSRLVKHLHDTGSLEGIDTSCLETLPPVKFVTSD